MIGVLLTKLQTLLARFDLQAQELLNGRAPYAVVVASLEGALMRLCA